MRQIIMSFAIAIVTVVFFQTCSSVPLTGRSQLNMIPSSEMLTMSFQQYDQFLKESKVITNTSEVSMVKQTGAKIQNAIERYMSENKLSDRLDGYEWDFNLVEDEQVNA